MRPSLGIDVAAPSELAWHELIELSNWPHWGPTVTGARLRDGGRRVSAGASGSVQTPLGLWLPFTVEQWHETEPLRVWSWRVAGLPATTHSVITQGATECRVEMSVPWLGSAYLTVVALALIRIRRRVEDRARG